MNLTPIICLSDVHGAFYTLLRLLDKCPRGARVFLNGDEIDRGPHSRKVVEWAMEHNIPTVKGNHTDLALAYSAHTKRGYKAYCSSYYDHDVWLYNGGEATLGNWPRFAPQGYICGNEIPTKVLDWMQALPPYIIPDAPLDENGRRLFLSHTGYGLEADQDTALGWYGALWGRHAYGDGPFPDDGYYRVFGHTQQKEPVITDTYAMIDTGAAYHSRGFGVLTAFHWPSKEITQQSYDETPYVPTRTIVNGCISE